MTRGDGDAATSAKQEPLLTRLHRVYPELPAGERRAADTALSAPGDLATYSAGELAERAGVSKATISRLVRRLGYGSYEEARRAARAMRATGSLLYMTDSENGPMTVSAAAASHLAAELAIVEACFSMLNPITLDEVTARLADAPRVRIAGFRNSHSAAVYGRTVLSQVRADVSLLLHPGQTLGEAAGDVRRGDLVILFGMRRRVARFVDFTRALAATGADVLLVADPTVREAPASARWTIICAVETPQPADSYAGVHALLRLLACQTIRRLGARGRRHLQRIEEGQAELGDLE